MLTECDEKEEIGKQDVDEEGFEESKVPGWGLSPFCNKAKDHGKFKLVKTLGLSDLPKEIRSKEKLENIRCTASQTVRLIVSHTSPDRSIGNETCGKDSSSSLRGAEKRHWSHMRTRSKTRSFPNFETKMSRLRKESELELVF